LNNQKRAMGSITVSAYLTAAACKSAYQKLRKCFNNIYFNAFISAISGILAVGQ